MAARSARAPFVGRREELAALTAALGGAVDGVASAVLVTGEAGVGKTRLVAELARHASAAGATVLVGGCVELSAGEVPYAPWLEAFRRVPEAAQLVERLGGGGPAVGSTGFVFPLVVDLLGPLSDRAPVVLVLEDLHWADRTSLELLAYLVRNLCQDRDLVGTAGSERVLLIGTARSDDLRRDDPRRAALAELERRCSPVHVGRMSRDDIAALVEGLLGAPDERLVSAVYDRSAGNCYLAEELATAGVDDPAAPLPDSLRDLLLRRVMPLSVPAREAVRAAAVVARPVSHALLAASCDLSDGELSAGLAEAVNATVLRYADDAYEFHHALVQEVAYRELLPGDRVRLHRSVATALAADPASGPAELAHHWHAAEVWDRALLSALLGARRSADLSAYAEAHALYERVLDLLPRLAEAGMSHVDGVRIPDRVSLLPDVADAAHWAGATTRAVELTREALAAVDGRRYPARNGALWERLGRYLWEIGDADGSLDADRAAAQVLESQPDSALRAKVLAALGTGLMIRGDHAAATEICVRAVDMARAVGARAEEAYALCTLGVSQAMTGALEDGLTTLRAAGALAGAEGRLEDVCRVYANLSFVLTNAGRLEESLQEAYAGIALTRTVQMERTAGGTMLVNAADTLFLLGRWEQAAALARGALSRGVAPLFAGHLLLTWGAVLLGTGRLDEAAQRLARAEVEGSGDATFLAELAAARAELALWSDDAEAASRHVAAGLAAEAHDPLLSARLHALAARAQADAAVRDRMLGRADAIARRQAVALQHASAAAALGGSPAGGPAAEVSQVQPEVVAQAATAAAEAERVTLRVADAAWREAAHAWAQVGQPFRLGYVLWRESEALLGAKRRRDAEATARRAARLAADLGAHLLGERVDRLAASSHLDLTATGTDPVPEPRTSGDAVRLTAREQQVLALVTAGRTNRQIARGLGISEKTASVHVSNILGKLGAANRVEAAAAAHALNLVEGRVTTGVP